VSPGFSHRVDTEVVRQLTAERALEDRVLEVGEPLHRAAPVKSARQTK
jgi:hypothetical protein